ncbi:hypothetical protein [Streptomyces malaysiensis]
MALPALATPDELAAYMQRAVDAPTAELALQLASGKVRGYINRPNLVKLTDATTCPDDVKSVVLALASRVVTNPDDVRTRQETVGTISESYTYATETIGVQLTALDRADLRRYRVRARVLDLGAAEAAEDAV